MANVIMARQPLEENKKEKHTDVAWSEKMVEDMFDCLDQAREEMDSRLKSVYQGGQALFMLPIGSTAVVDATRKGSIARLGGHSCDPNAEVKPWLVEVSFALIQPPGM